MEKLIELLNEYDNKLVGEYHWEIEGEDILAYSKFWGGYETINVAESIIISKWYEFVEWLVDNDKIDLDEIPYLTDELGGGFDEYEEVIMILSISDTPIEDLISYLK